MAKRITREELEQILVGGVFDALIGVVETDWLDFKRDPYHLRNAENKSELAKDVAALATHAGGFILIGMSTVKNPAHRGEEVDNIATFPESHIDSKQYHEVLKSWIYPAVQVEIKWYKSKPKPEGGIFSIQIQKQAEHLWPPLLTQPIIDGGKRRGILVGYVERKQDFTDVKRVEEIHEIIRSGTTYVSKLKDMAADIAEIKDKIYGATPVPIPKVEDIEILLDERIQDAIRVAEIQHVPSFVLSAATLPTTDIPYLFEPDDKRFKELEEPESIRSGGYDISIPNFSRNIYGKQRRAVSKNREIRELWRDGVLIFAADFEYLCWGAPKEYPTLINSLAITESTYLFMKHFKKLIGVSTSTPKRLLFRIELRSSVKEKWLLAPGSLNWRNRAFPHDYKKSPAPDVVGKLTVDWKTENYDPGVLAFRLVAQVYNSFGFDNDAIPYSNKTDDGQKAIEPDEILRLHGR